MAFEPGDNMNSHNNYFLSAIGRRRPGVTVEQSRLELQQFAERIRAQFPESRHFGMSGTPLLEVVVAGVRPAVLVLLLGLAGAAVVTRLARSLLFSVSPTDPLVFGGTALTLAATALLASYLPARRAARIDPMATLREG